MFNRFSFCAKLLSVFLFVSLLGRASWAYTPEHPEVQALVKRGIEFIEKNHGKHRLDDAMGGYAVCAMAIYSQTGDVNHPLVRAAVEQIRRGVQDGFPGGEHANYSLGLALILLGTLDAANYPAETQALLNEIYRRQMSNGAWSYENFETGDTSQTQYACLGMWMAHRQGIQVRIPVVANVTNWLLRTQAPDGGFGYQGKDPGSFTRVPQERTTPSMGVAGAGSLYVLGELLGYIDDPKTTRLRSRLPPAIQPVIAKREVVSDAVDKARWQTSVKDADAWCARNAGVKNPFHQYYYMYTVERYWAFKELALDRKEAEPAWYNQGVEYLKGEVAADGSWSSSNGPTVGTAFAVLFLLRSSQRTVARIQLDRGILSGGQGLPSDLSNAKVNSKGQVVTISPEKSVDEVLAMLEDPERPQADYVADIPEKITLPTDPKQRELKLTQLRRLLINGSFQARLTVAQTLGTLRDLDSAPALIFALSDPDYRVEKAARDSLRFMSRKPNGFGFEIGNEQPPKHIYEQAQKNWTNWLLSVKPDAELLE